MQAGLKLWGENHIDRPLQLDSAKTFKCFRNYPHRIVCFTARGGTRMPRMFGAIIGDFEQFRFKRLL